MRVLHILDHSVPLHSGYTFRTLSIIKEQRALGWETIHLTSSKQGNFLTPSENVDGWVFHRTPAATGAVAKLPVLNQVAVISGLTKRLEEIVRNNRPDVLHAHSPALNAVAAIRVGRKFNIPVVYEVRAFWEDAAVDHGTSREWGVRYRLTRALESHVLKRADAVTTICEGLRNEILERGIQPDKVTVIPNAVNIQDFGAGAPPDRQLLQQLGLEGTVRLGFIGSFYAYEGLNVLLQAMPSMLKHKPEVRLLLVGGGPQERQLKELAAQLGLSDKVIFTGRVPHDQVQRYYDMIDVLVYPRLRMRLTDLVTPLKPLEAMAQGRLVAASNVGGHRELIEDGKTGVLFESNNPNDLSKKVLALANNATLWPQLRSSGRNFVETQRNWPTSVARYKHVYGPLVSGTLAK